AALRDLAERAEHTRVVGAGVVADREDRVAVVEVFEQHRALADAYSLGKTDAGRLVAHVRAVGEVVGAELAGEELVEEGGLVGGAAGGVELGLVRIGERLKAFADAGYRIFPGDRTVAVGRAVV